MPADGNADTAKCLPRGVIRALGAMRANPGLPLNLAKIAGIAGVSVRTLQRLFRTYLDNTPLAALRDIRFECARRDLVRSSPTDRVTDIAQRSGFSHLGRFSLEYCRRFGEAPSKTLRRRASYLAKQPFRTRFAALDVRGPPVAVSSIETSEDNKAFAKCVAEELEIVLLRAGILVEERPERARYRLRGTLRSDGGQLCLTLRLIETEGSGCVWAYRHSGMTEDELLDEERLATVAAGMQRSLRSAEIEHARRKPDVDLTARDLTLKALPHVLLLNPEGNIRALDLLARALVSDPDDLLATALAAWCHAQRVAYQFAISPIEDRVQALYLARRAMSFGGDATVLSILGNAFYLTGDLETAEIVTQRALTLDGSSAWAWSRSGMIELGKGHPEWAIEQLTIALDLAPDDPLVFNVYLARGSAYFYARRYPEAVRAFERAALENPSAFWGQSMLCPAYMFCGRTSAARHSLAELQRKNPQLTISRIIDGFSFFPEHCRNRIAEGLDTAGLPR